MCPSLTIAYKRIISGTSAIGSRPGRGFRGRRRRAGASRQGPGGGRFVGVGLDPVADPLAAVGQADEGLDRDPSRPSRRRPGRGRRSGWRRSHPTARRRRARRSARKRRLVADGATAASAASSPARNWRTSAPWPAAGVIVSAGIAKVASSSRPSRRSPAAARTIASSSPSASLRRRVSTLPCSSLDPQVGPGGEELGAAAQAGGADPGALGTSSSEAPAPIQASAGVLARGHRADRQPVGQLGRKILGRVHADLGLAREQRPLDPAHETGLVAGLAVGGDLDQPAHPTVRQPVLEPRQAHYPG